SATHAVLWDGQLAITDLGTLGGTASRALRVSDFPGEVFGESRTVEGDLHPAQWLWFSQRIADFAHVLGADSQIQSVVPATRDDVYRRVISGAASPGADVHAYIVSVPTFVEPGPPRTINDGVIEVLQGATGRARFAFTTEDATADVSVRQT